MIQIPRYSNVQYDTEESLTAMLRFLETRECRKFMQEENRVAQRRSVTERFRALLRRNEIFRGMAAAKTMSRDEIYS